MDNSFKVNRGLNLNPQTTVPTNPVNGDFYYDTTLNTFVFYDNGFWINLASRTDIASATSITSAQLTAIVVQNSLIRITGATTTNIYGLLASTDGKNVTIYNASTAFISLKNNDSTEATAANRIVTYNSSDLTLSPGQAVSLAYDAGQSRWIVSSSVGSGSGSGTGDDLDALQYSASFTDNFETPANNVVSSVNVSTGFTNALYVGGQVALYRMSYDASKTVTGTGTAMTLSAAPAFTIQVGDMLIVGGQAKRITAVASQTSITIESAFATNPATAVCNVSQALYTKDLNNFAADGDAVSSIYTGTISDCLVTYNDTSSGTLYNYTDPALINYTASSDGTTYTSATARESNLSVNASLTGLPTTGTNLYIRFFSSATSGNGTVNLVGYKAFFHKDANVNVGGIVNQAICFSNSVGTPVGCTNPTVVGGKTTVGLNWSYPTGINAGTANGSIRVVLNGSKVPRFINSTLTPDASYTEASATSISLDKDYSGLNYSIEVYEDVAIIDSNSANSNNIAAILSVLQPVGTVTASMLTQAQFQAQTSTNWILADGRSVTGTVYATLTGNSTVPDLRGVALRGKNNGRVDGDQNPDGDLTLGTFQGDQYVSHTHSDAGHAHTTWFPTDPNHTLSSGGGTTGILQGTTGSTSTAAAAANIQLSGGNETRMKNVTVNYFIRIN